MRARACVHVRKKKKKKKRKRYTSRSRHCSQSNGSGSLTWRSTLAWIGCPFLSSWSRKNFLFLEGLFSDSEDELFVLFSTTNCVGAKESLVNSIVLQNFLPLFKFSSTKWIYFSISVLSLLHLRDLSRSTLFFKACEEDVKWEELKKRTQLRKLCKETESIGWTSQFFSFGFVRVVMQERRVYLKRVLKLPSSNSLKGWQAKH